MNKQSNVKSAVWKYIAGFTLCLVLTLMAFGLVFQSIDGGGAGLSLGTVIAMLVGLAVIQLMVQLFFFLHLGHESKPRWNLIVFLFMLLVLGIVVFGSLWIMENLNYNMTSQEMHDYMKEHPGSF